MGEDLDACEQRGNIRTPLPGWDEELLGWYPPQNYCNSMDLSSRVGTDPNKCRFTPEDMKVTFSFVSKRVGG